ncbi:hypothetical protein [Marinobacterium mangrovicola]|uniref:Zinc-regulated TonB-dependent outer membrane receptor n=1 Tax=Marinobacterium mangrovicola TaxID=1476959 RepID=A0A4R1G9Z0_9GAMM|nr:hypothetical protein [Marinobacterium mangrovicola]TCK04774.1 hypothetical protein CLV83_3223 [Marinobacterium mangrovicola]
MRIRVLKPALLTLAVASVSAQAADQYPNVSLTVDAYHKSDNTALGGRHEGWGLSHTELSVSQRFGNLFDGTITAVGEANEEETEFNFEEVYLQTLALPAGMTLRAGRFLSDIGYLNGQHPHADSFTERPLIYRSFLGGHYYDDGIGLNVVMPTELYWRVGAEAFTGDELGEFDHDRTIGAWTVSSKVGGDIGASQSWQAGVSYLRNRMLDQGGAHEEHAHDEHEHEHEHEHEDDAHHGHSHGAEYAGKHLYLADIVWKWSPQGNNRGQQLTLSGEYIRATDPNESAASSDYHEGWYGSAVYRFSPQWSAGIRHGRVDLQMGHDDHFHEASMTESTLMLAWNPTHTQTVRLQYAHQDVRKDWQDTLSDSADNALTLQYIISFGAHDAHAF